MRERKYPDLTRSAINRANSLKQWEGHVRGEHEWATIRVHKEVREELCQELVRISGTTRRGVYKPGQMNWSVFLKRLLDDARSWRSRRRKSVNDEGSNGCDGV